MRRDCRILRQRERLSGGLAEGLREDEKVGEPHAAVAVQVVAHVKAVVVVTPARTWLQIARSR